MAKQRTLSSAQQYGGFNRSRYFFWMLGLGVFGALAVAIPFLVKLDSGLVAGISMALFIASTLGSFYPLVKRYQNQVASGWWALGSLVPILNIYVGIRALAYPPGYNQHKTFDGPAKIILALFAGLLAVVLIGGALNKFGSNQAPIKEYAKLLSAEAAIALPNDAANSIDDSGVFSVSASNGTAQAPSAQRAAPGITSTNVSACDAKIDEVMQKTKAVYAHCPLPELHDLKECAPAKVHTAPPVENFDAITVLDMSGSMAGRVAGMSKYNIAREMLGEVLQYAAPTASLGLMVYGHLGNNTDSGKSSSCVPGELLAAVGSTPSDIIQVVEQLKPTGWTPIASSLSALRERVLADPERPVRVTVISDGLETCDGNPVEQARLLKEAGADVSVNVIGFDVANDEVKQLRAIAKAGGGVFFDAKGRHGLREAALAEVRTRNEKIMHRACSAAELAKFKIYSQGSAAHYRNCVSGTATKEWAAAREVASAWLIASNEQGANAQTPDYACTKQLQAVSKERYDDAKRHANEVYENVKAEIALSVNSKPL